MIPALLIGSATLGMLTAASIFTARALVHWPEPPSVVIHQISNDRVALQATPLARYEGTYGLRTASGHARLGAVLDDNGRTVTRKILETHGDILTAQRATLDGDIHHGPGELGEYADVSIRTELGDAPAWRFAPGTDTDLWIIHVHGYQTDRLNALRTVDALRDVAAVHLVVSYRGDGEGPPAPNGTTRLGLDEWRDIDDALAYAAANGAARILMVGWSLGAAIVLLAGERSTRRDLIVGNLFVSPATNWRATVTTIARRMRIPFPRLLSACTTDLLSSRLAAPLTGVAAPIDFDELDWTRTPRVHVPTLAIHSAGDLTVPIDATRKFQAANPTLVRLVETKRAPHTREFNVDPDGFRTAINSWLPSVL